mmetsp:Transcript_12916/g.25057  ORF Transcript_12916/g.25057 Transcript_12916/m.25057 type:complete len:379 (-) Transcript_12916:315-1451(-)|eukprot:CAMPEP_0171494818 /NCGR_PEP_ID=MMETSP0958-20121227/5773_1 /TAXON_ID=87120 /ORGANISM="Aurantiochytrium limacinum, Strain ATCCMYA-1381" /LENGTH=378 /DNA_ID=CAMNT_0012028683 /DNA_START=263 /DNA_END=1399 /DNA_ORIENTATION=-
MPRRSTKASSVRSGARAQARSDAVSNSVSKINVRGLADIVQDPGRRNWGVYRLQGVRRTGIRDPESFEYALKEALAPFFTLSVKAAEFKESLWIQLKGKTGIQLLTQENVFVVYPPHSKFIFVTPFRGKDATPIFCQALSNVFQCSNVEELPLFGKDVTTLKDLALRKLSQGAFSAYRLCAEVFDHDPLQDQASLAKRRRAVINKILGDERDRDALSQLKGKDGNRVIRKTEARAPAQRFTCPTISKGNHDDDIEGAGLRTVCLKSKDDLRSEDESRTDVENFQCYIRLEGSNVLRGLEALYANDMVCDNKEIPSIFDVDKLLVQADGDYSEILTAGEAEPSRSTKRKRGDTTERASTRLVWARSGVVASTSSRDLSK